MHSTSPNILSPYPHHANTHHDFDNVIVLEHAVHIDFTHGIAHSLSTEGAADLFECE